MTVTREDTSRWSTFASTQHSMQTSTVDLRLIVSYGVSVTLTIVARRVQVVRSVVRCLNIRFSAWADDFIELYFKSMACPYAEVS